MFTSIFRCRSIDSMFWCLIILDAFLWAARFLKKSASCRDIPAYWKQLQPLQAIPEEARREYPLLNLPGQREANGNLWRSERFRLLLMVAKYLFTWGDLFTPDSRDIWIIYVRISKHLPLMNLRKSSKLPPYVKQLVAGSNSRWPKPHPPPHRHQLFWTFERIKAFSQNFSLLGKSSLRRGTVSSPPLDFGKKGNPEVIIRFLGWNQLPGFSSKQYKSKVNEPKNKDEGDSRTGQKKDNLSQISSGLM